MLIADKKRFWLGTLSAINHEPNNSMPMPIVNPKAYQANPCHHNLSIL